MAEWSKAADCKSVSYSLIGSNPIYSNKITNLSPNLKLNTTFSNINPYFYKVYNIAKKNKHLNKSLIKSIYTVLLSPLFIKNKIFNKKLMSFFLIYYNTYLLSYIYRNLRLMNNSFILKFIKKFLINFKRNRFFPTLLNYIGHTYTTLSLGVFFRFFYKPKSFRKSKQLYYLLIHFFRKIIIYSNINLISILVKHTPRFLNELIQILVNKSSTSYQHPLINSLVIDEKKSSLNNKNFVLNIFSIKFFNNKFYGKLNLRKKGVVKRKILRKISKNNLIVD